MHPSSQPRAALAEALGRGAPGAWLKALMAYGAVIALILGGVPWRHGPGPGPVDASQARFHHAGGGAVAVAISCLGAAWWAVLRGVVPL
jgi:hypothetical protein